MVCSYLNNLEQGQTETAHAFRELISKPLSSMIAILDKKPDFIQARAGSPDIDSLGWTDREFSCLEAILDHKREGHQGERCLGD